MTGQYLPTNINAPRSPRETDVGLVLNLDDELIIITAAAPQITLPNATVIPSRQIYIKSVPGTGTVIGTGGQTIDGAATFTFTTVQEVLLVKSDGANWRIAGGGGGGSGVALTVEDEGVVVDAAVALINFTGAGVTATPAGAGSVDVTITGSGLAGGPLIPETNVIGSPGDPYTRISGTVSSFWQFVGAAAGVLGWEALGPWRTATPVGAVNGVNTSYTFPLGVEAVHQGADSPQIKYERNGVEQLDITDFIVVAGAIPGTTIVSFTTTIAPVLGDLLKVTYIPA